MAKAKEAAPKKESPEDYAARKAKVRAAWAKKYPDGHKRLSDAEQKAYQERKAKASK